MFHSVIMYLFIIMCIFKRCTHFTKAFVVVSSCVLQANLFRIQIDLKYCKKYSHCFHQTANSSRVSSSDVDLEISKKKYNNQISTQKYSGSKFISCIEINKATTILKQILVVF